MDKLQNELRHKYICDKCGDTFNYPAYNDVMGEKVCPYCGDCWYTINHVERIN